MPKEKGTILTGTIIDIILDKSDLHIGPSYAILVIVDSVEANFGNAFMAPTTSSSVGSVYMFMVRCNDECRIAAWATRGATPALLR